MQGKKRAVIMARVVKTTMVGGVPTPQQVDMCQVFNGDTTLAELQGFLESKGTTNAQIIFETEAPELPREDDKERGN